jgi:hypothetical protein
VDLREVARLARASIVLHAPDLASSDAMGGGPRLRAIKIFLHSGQPVPRLCADVVCLVPLNLEGPSAIHAIGPVCGEMRELELDMPHSVHAVSIGAVTGLERLRLHGGPNMKSIEGLEGRASLVSASVRGRFESLDFLRGCPLADLRIAAPFNDVSTVALADLSRIEPMKATLRDLELEYSKCAEAFAKAPALALDRLALVVPQLTQELQYAKWNEVLASNLGVRVLCLRGHALESTYELPPLAALEELDLTKCRGFLELGSMKTRFPKLRKLVVTGTALKKRDVDNLTRDGVQVVV